MSIDYLVFDQNESAEQYLEAVYDLATLCFDSGAAPYLNQNDKTFFAQSLGVDYVKVLAFKQEQLVGFGLLRMMKQWPQYFDFLPQPKEPCALLLNILVHPDYRGHGIGSQLTQRRITAIKNIGIKHLYATVHPDNKSNIRIVERHGMRVIAKKQLFTANLMRLVMYKALE